MARDLEVTVTLCVLILILSGVIDYIARAVLNTTYFCKKVQICIVLIGTCHGDLEVTVTLCVLILTVIECHRLYCAVVVISARILVQLFHADNCNVLIGSFHGDLGVTVTFCVLI